MRFRRGRLLPSSTGSTATGTTPVKGGTAVFAEPPSTPPNYMFPFMSSAYASNTNIFNFQYLMYRPLYWFGHGCAADAEPVAEPGLPADVQRHQGHDQR